MESDLSIAQHHLTRKKEALTRVYEEFVAPYHTDNAQIYLNNKYNKAVAIAERGYKEDLALGIATTTVGTLLLVPTVWPKQHPDIRIFSGFFSAFAYIFSAPSLYNLWHYKKPTMVDIVNKVKLKLNKNYDGKRLFAKKMGLRNWASQPQAAQNPYNK